MSKKNCIWTYDEDDDMWDTSCKKSFCLPEGSPIDNGMCCCCYCGKPITISQKT